MPDEPVHEHPARTDLSTDAALVLATVERMDATARRDRATLERLRGVLGEMARAITQAKIAINSQAGSEAKAIGMAALLDEFEHLVDAMIEIAGAAAPAASAATSSAGTAPKAPVGLSEEVPTVSGVMSRSGGHDDFEPEPVTDLTSLFKAARDKTPSVAMLKAMVEALGTSNLEPTDPTDTEAAGEPPAPIAAEGEPAAEPATKPAADVWPETAETEPSAPEESTNGVNDASMLAIERALMSMGPEPLLTPSDSDSADPDPPPVEVPPEQLLREGPDWGTSAPADPPAQQSAVEGDVPSSSAEDVASDFAAVLGEPPPPEPAVRLPGYAVVVRESELLAHFEQMESVPVLPPELGTAVIFTREPTPEADASATRDAAQPAPPIQEPPVDQPVSQEEVRERAVQSRRIQEHLNPKTLRAAIADRLAAAARVRHETVSRSAPAAVLGRGEAEFDPAEFLFGPEPLTEPSPAPAPEAPAAGNTSVCPTLSPLPRRAVSDPLGAVKAMTPAERIALFS